jgi:hypothetical protein
MRVVAATVVVLLLGAAIVLVFATKVKRDMKRSTPRVDALAERQKWIAFARKLLTLCVEIQRTSNVLVTEKGFADPQILALALLSRTSAIPSFFRGPKCNWRLALRCDESRVTSPEAQVRGCELSGKRSCHAQGGSSGPPFAPYERQKASKLGRSRIEGIPEALLPIV